MSKIEDIVGLNSHLYDKSIYMRRVIFLLLISLFSISAFSQSLTLKDKDLKKLVKRMAGEFSSEQQSKNDSDYFHIKLRMKQIWKDRTDGYWLYVEQAIASAEAKPYRQRVYHVYKENDTTIASQVFELKNPMQYAGGWNDVAKLSPITQDSLVNRQGCTIFLHKTKEGVFQGSTPGKECLSSLRGATYATSEVQIFKDKLLSWDRGWDKNDKQMWGAEKGGYIFIRLRSL